jgi:hypothetical protein
VILAILRALVSVTRRDLAGHSLIRTNNFFLFVALLIWGALVSGVEPMSSYPFLALLAFLLFFPISSDPLERIPEVRLGVWPVGAAGRITLRLASLVLNPIVWLAAAMWIGGLTVFSSMAMVAAAVVRAKVPGSVRGFAIERAAPFLPGGFGALVTHHLREMLTVLDVWLALVLAAIGTAWRVGARPPDSAAWRILSILIGIALSTWAQCGSGLDSTRYRLLPIRAWRILLARDAAYLTVQVVLTAGLNPIAGLTFGMTALAVGRYTSLHGSLRQARWRFASGRVMVGAAQMILASMVAFAGGWAGVGAAALWMVSVIWGGVTLTERLRSSRAPPRRIGSAIARAAAKGRAASSRSRERSDR